MGKKDVAARATPQRHWLSWFAAKTDAIVLFTDFLLNKNFDLAANYIHVL